MTKTILIQTIQHSLELFESGKNEESKKVLRDLFKNDGLDRVDQGLYDLAMETYIFLYDGDLRKEGRNFGFANTEEIRLQLKKLA